MGGVMDVDFPACVVGTKRTALQVAQAHKPSRAAPLVRFEDWAELGVNRVIGTRNRTLSRENR